MLGSVTLDLDPVDRGHSIVGSGEAHWLGKHMAAWLVLTTGCRNLCPMRPFKFPDFVLPRGTQAPYLAAVDLAEGYEVSQLPPLTSISFVHLFKISGMERTQRKYTQAMRTQNSNFREHLTHHEMLSVFSL
ncbi:hypothetical protein M9H77_11670 [Catharanthus roseus]|uniref:Uncharacterized protein n=1 Tax=Catharanthus roseus TaxID=4058 RepID=A0ACC0BFA7_CATRO|nr:hypothetical protein M9H77_11670 [Catharanthus roseus]